jgi:hypothetical protein
MSRPGLLRAVGALALLGVAADHLEELTAGHYAAIPTIGTLFTLDVVAATVLAVALLLPAHRLPGRAGRAVPAVVALAGIGVAGGSLVALFVSEQTPLFGFMESGYRLAIVVAVACGAAAVLALGADLARSARGTAGRRWHPAPAAGPVPSGPRPRRSSGWAART